jgi:hypothetical protein
MYKVYWTDDTNTSKGIYTSTLQGALRISEEKRKAGCTFVTMVSEDPNVVGPQGVDSVENGMLPDGNKYSWYKRRRP